MSECMVVLRCVDNCPSSRREKVQTIIKLFIKECFRNAKSDT